MKLCHSLAVCFAVYATGVVAQNLKDDETTRVNCQIEKQCDIVGNCQNGGDAFFIELSGNTDRHRVGEYHLKTNSGDYDAVILTMAGPLFWDDELGTNFFVNTTYSQAVWSLRHRDDETKGWTRFASCKDGEG